MDQGAWAWWWGSHVRNGHRHSARGAGKASARAIEAHRRLASAFACGGPPYGGSVLDLPNNGTFDIGHVASASPHFISGARPVRLYTVSPGSRGSRPRGGVAAGP